MNQDLFTMQIKLQFLITIFSTTVTPVIVCIMLAEKKKKMRLPMDPNNKNWTEDTSSFGRKMLEKMGWKTGQGLGVNGDGTTTHIKISVKDDTLGIGASQKDTETGWLNNSKSYQEVLDRLAKSLSQEGDDEMKKKNNDKKSDDKKKKEKKKKDKKSDDKDKRKKDKSLKVKVEKSKSEKKTATSSQPTILKSAHRAKFIKNKAVSSYSEAHLKEILGGINI